MTVTDRPTWETLPQFVREAVEERLGTVVKSECVHSRRPGLAARIYATEEDAFLKAVPLKFADHILEPFRRERQAASFLPWPGAPAPWLAWRREVGDWLILAFELINDRARYVNLRPDDQDVPIVVGAVERLSWQPCREGWKGIIPSAREHVHALMDTARSLLDQPPVALTDPQLYSRAVDRLSVDRLAAGVPTLVHGDLCRKNILYKESCA
ncbi:hypothetical protein GCM10009733_006360 [Nonomuraea maheshkhaliensis]|uniref:Aminoglycoside phosphotransferase domain-containing protein n=1 Tax=Nonomuraea maheshkhaliensis TaxID=419590 RepID=A0ABN2ENV3_9ACTN